MASVVDSIAQYVATDLSLGTLGSTVFEDSMPDAADGSIDTCIAVYNVPGAAPDLTQGDNTDRPSFMVVCRSLSADTALANDLAIYDALHGLTETSVHGTYFLLIAAVQSAPTPLGRDEKARLMWARNFRAIVRGVTR
ncbi:MAG TPA: minor capsid protein [Tepidiformaceae bacterium]|nr:minor capsid protein [Tepidiformaceae bacterium]